MGKRGMAMKVCRTCGERKLRDEFHARKDSPDGLRSSCKVCRRAYSRQWNADNAERKRASSRAWVTENAERHRKTNRQRYRIKPQYFKDKSAEWRAKNSDRKLASDRRWRNENRGRDRATKAKYKAAKLNATPPWVNYSEIVLIYDQCPAGHHVDHIVPLQGENVCGLHVPWNLQYLSETENLKKGNRLLEAAL